MSDGEERDTSKSAAFPPMGPRQKSKMAHIDDATLTKILSKLEEMQSESRAVVNQHVATDLSSKEQAADVGDDLDQAVNERDREFNLIMHQRHLRRLQQIQDALVRIEDGSYGICEGTDEPINPRRLVIMPLARYSLEYQEQQEKMLGRSPEDTYAPAEDAFSVEE
jgi:DnaK suppressor protein